MPSSSTPAAKNTTEHQPSNNSSPPINSLEIEPSVNDDPHVPCDNCCGNAVDRLFLGNIMRPLFEQGNQQQVKDGLINFVTSSGVVSALFISISIEYSFGIAATDWVSTLMATMWYLSTYLSMWCVVVSTILGVLLSITPENNIMTVGKKMLYAWTFPGWLMMSSCGCLVVAIWARAEVDHIQVFATMAEASNSSNTAVKLTQASLAHHALIVVWLARVGFVITILSAMIGFLIVLCCTDGMETYLGIETLSRSNSKGARRSGNGEGKARNVLNPLDGVGAKEK